MLVHLITHCYAAKRPVFARMLTAQLSSLWLWPPQCSVMVTVCGHYRDDALWQTLAGFRRQFNSSQHRVAIHTAWYPEAMLFRRAIGRNIAAKTTGADVVWFIDADYLLGPGCLDALAAVDFASLPSKICYPQQVQIHRAHHIGDAELARIVPGEVFEPDLGLFETKNEKFAIGGLQIVSGDTARAHGYLDGTKWVQPVPDAKDFLDTKDDKAYRAALGGSCPVELPNVYRLRHSASAFEPPEKRLAQTAHVQ